MAIAGNSWLGERAYKWIVYGWSFLHLFTGFILLDTSPFQELDSWSFAKALLSVFTQSHQPKKREGIPIFSRIDHKNDFYRPLVGALNEFWKGILGDFMLIASTFNHYTPENQHGTWKSPVWQGRSSSKPPFLGSILVFGGHGVRENTKKNLLDEWPQGWVDFLNWIRRFVGPMDGISFRKA